MSDAIHYRGDIHLVPAPLHLSISVSSGAFPSELLPTYVLCSVSYDRFTSFTTSSSTSPLIFLVACWISVNCDGDYKASKQAKIRVPHLALCCYQKVISLAFEMVGAVARMDLMEAKVFERAKVIEGKDTARDISGMELSNCRARSLQAKSMNVYEFL